ncbi:MAG: tRNA (adenosine(37)-N6)-dimethylallyltransferase MiaA [Bacteroidaceae bacterium]|nr:tRNA (adenosine(37)-N6)-dimethylallyltransferase MiaA [Bacteroidaceae bacterium]
MAKSLIVLLGPTAVGKTSLTLRLAEYFDCPILNADSRQLYRDIPIITAAPTAQECARVPHHFVGTLGLQDYYSAARYEEEVMAWLTAYFEQSDVALLSGGSMMYIDAVCNGIDELPTVDVETRSHLQQRLVNEGLDALAEELRLLDPDYYATCDIRNPKRVVHALEICYMSGTTYSSLRVKTQKSRPFQIIKIGLQREREELFGRINQRVSDMIELGALEEVRRVQPYRNENSLNTVGIKELLKVIDGEWELNFALERLRKNTRVYAKKQMTWFKKDESIRWFHPDEWQQILAYIQEQRTLSIEH